MRQTAAMEKQNTDIIQGKARQHNNRKAKQHAQHNLLEIVICQLLRPMHTCDMYTHVLITIQDCT